MKKVIILLFVFISIFNISFAHPGRTDNNGGHYDRSTGEYHYHDGDGSLLQVGTEEEEQEIIDNYETQIEELQEEIRDKDETIVKLNRELDEKDNELSDLENNITSGIVFGVIIIAIFILWKTNPFKKK